MIDAAAAALAAVPGWAWAGVALVGAGVGRAVSSYQAERTMRKEVQGECEVCHRTLKACTCPARDTSRTLRMTVEEIAAGVRDVRGTVGRVDERLIRVEGRVDRIEAQGNGQAAEVGRADPLAHLVDDEPRERKER